MPDRERVQLAETALGSHVGCRSRFRSGAGRGRRGFLAAGDDARRAHGDSSADGALQKLTAIGVGVMHLMWWHTAKSDPVTAGLRVKNAWAVPRAKPRALQPAACRGAGRMI